MQLIVTAAALCVAAAAVSFAYKSTPMNGTLVFLGILCGRPAEIATFRLSSEAEQMLALYE
jgi:hypothetical protein